MKKEDLYLNLDLLIKIANPKETNLDVLNATLDDLNEKQNNLKVERKELKNDMTDDRYYDATSEIVDRNNIVNLKKKITRLNSKVKDSETKLNHLIKEEEQTHIKVIGLEASITEDTILLESLKERVSELKPDSDATDYNDSIALTEDNLKNNQESLDNLRKEYDVIVADLDNATNEKTAFDEELKNAKNELASINEALKTRDKYVNQDLKEADNEKLAVLDAEIKEIDDKKLVIINNPIFMVNEIKEYIEKEDLVSAMNKTKELVAIIENMPYMDITDNKKLNDLKASLEQEKVDFVSFINKKNYDEINLDFISSRIIYLNNLINNYNEEIDFTLKKVRKIDENVKVVNEYLKSALKEVEIVETDITLYQNILNGDEVLTPTRKNAIETILNKKEEELSVLNRIISSYRLEESKLIRSIKDVHTNEIAILKDKISACDNEKEELNNIMNNLKAKNHDILAEESDKEVLHQFDERLSALDNRLNITESINDIKKDIESFFDKSAVLNEEKTATPNIVFTPFDPIEESKNNVEPSENNNDDEINFVDFDENKFLETPESNVVNISDIVDDNTSQMPPLFKEDTETINIFDDYNNTDTYDFNEVTNFNLPKFHVGEEEPVDSDLLEVVDVSPIVVDDTKNN